MLESVQSAQAAQGFSSAEDIMIEDDKKYFVVDKRNKHGYTDKFCLLCSKFMTFEHIRHRPKTQHRDRRIHPEDYITEAVAEQWKKREAEALEEEDKKKTPGDGMAFEDETP